MAKARKVMTETLEGERPAAEPAARESAGDTTAAGFDRERIARRAYELYMARGRADGQDFDDWLAAEQQLSGDRD
jgi:hypothetical protein